MVAIGTTRNSRKTSASGATCRYVAQALMRFIDLAKSDSFRPHRPHAPLPLGERLGEGVLEPRRAPPHLTSPPRGRGTRGSGAKRGLRPASGLRRDELIPLLD